MSGIPKICKAAVYEKVDGDLSNVTVKDTPIAKPGPGEVIVKSEFASLNPVDGMVMAGYLRSAGWALPLPFTMGYDLSGTVAAVGQGVCDLQEGDRVFGVNWGQNSHDVENGPIAGTFKEFATIKASMLSKIPEGVSMDKAAAVALVGTTAYQGLFEHLQVKQGSRVLILGGSGAVGQLAVQMAKKAGAWVATTCSPRNMDFVKSLNPDYIINYREKRWFEDPKLVEIDAILATVAEQTPWTHAKKILKKGTGRYASISDQEVGFDPKGHESEGYPFASFYCLSNSVKVQDKLAQDIKQGNLKIFIDEVFPFTTKGLHEALKKQNTGASVGKNLFQFSADKPEP